MSMATKLKHRGKPSGSMIPTSSFFGFLAGSVALIANLDNAAENLTTAWPYAEVVLPLISCVGIAFIAGFAAAIASLAAYRFVRQRQARRRRRVLADLERIATLLRKDSPSHAYEAGMIAGLLTKQKVIDPNALDLDLDARLAYFARLESLVRIMGVAHARRNAKPLALDLRKNSQVTS